MKGEMGEEEGKRTKEQERAPWKRTCKMVYEESRGGGGRVAAPAAQLQLPFSSSACARARARAGPDIGVLFLSLSFSLGPFLSIYLCLGLSFLAGPYARVLARTPPVLWRAPTLINAKLQRRRAYFRADTRDGDARLPLFSPRLILHRLEINIRH